MKEISTTEAQHLLETSSDHYLLDVRTSAEYQEGHLEGTYHIDIYAPGFEGRVKELPKDKPWLVYCRSGGRSATACQVMEPLGFDATNVVGGITAWRGKVV